jgi:hypothetical protein
MLASWVGEATPTSSPIETRCVLTLPSNGAGHLGVAAVDLGYLGVDVGLMQIGLGVVACGGRIIQRRLRDRLSRDQIGLPLEIGLGLPDRSLRGLGGLRLLELQLIGLELDREQGRSFFHEGAVLILDRMQEALDARDQVDGLDRGGVVGGLEITPGAAWAWRPRPSAVVAERSCLACRPPTGRGL